MDSTLAERTVLITGAAGFLGGVSARHCADAGARVIATDVRPGDTTTPIDLRDRQAVDHLLADNKVDYVIHCAAFGHGGAGLKASADGQPDLAIDVNVGGALNLVRACTAHHVTRILYASSTTVYGSRGSYPPGRIDEDAPRRPRDMYGATKVAAEVLGHTLAAAGGVEFIAIRLPLVYGPKRWYGGALSDLMNLVHAASDSPTPATQLSDSEIDWIHEDDAADAFIHAATARLTHDAYHIVGHTGSVLELARRTLIEQGRDITVLSASHTDAGAEVPLVSDERARNQLRFQPAISDVAAASKALARS